VNWSQGWRLVSVNLGLARTITHSSSTGITQNFTTEADVPALKLSFGVLQEEQIQDSDDEVLDLSKLELGLLRENTITNYMQLGNYSTVALT